MMHNTMTMPPKTGRTITTQRSAAVRRGIRWSCLPLLALLCGPGFSQAPALTPLPVIVADFNQDGLPDALIPSATDATATIAFGSVPYGTFSNAKGVTFPAGCTNAFAPRALVTGDFNGDGLPDIAFVCTSDPIIAGVILGNGDGTFRAPQLITGIFSSSIVAADFNHDGKLDLLVVGPATSAATSQSIQFFSGNGDGTFAAVVSTALPAAGNYSAPIAIDLNADGYPDLVAGDFFDAIGSTVNVFGNNKDGTFGVVTSGTAAPNVSLVVGAYGTSFDQTILAGNFFNASQTDLAVPDAGSAAPGIVLIKNTSTSSAFSLAPGVKTAYPALESALAGSFTGSAVTDLAVYNGTGIAILANDGTGTFSASYASLTLAATSPLFAVADANLDGYADIYTASSQSGVLGIHASLVTGSATATAAPITLPLGTSTVTAIWPGNINFTGSTASGTQTVVGSPAAVTLTSSSNPAPIATAIMFTTVVAPAPGVTSIPTGTVSVTDGRVLIGSGSLDSTGSFTFSTSTLASGSHNLLATYSGDNFFAASTSSALLQVVNAAVAPTLTWTTPDPIAFGTALTDTQLDAIATDANGTTVPGTFVYTPAAGTVLPVGIQTLSVVFTPTDATRFTVATASVNLIVQQAVSTTTLTLTSGGSATTAVAQGTVVTLTASVNVGTLPITAGQVNFCDAAATFCTDIHLLGTAQLTAAGTAVLRLVPGIGTHSYKAVFLPTIATAASTSIGSTLTVTGTHPTTTTIAQSGAPGSYTLTATTVGVGSLTASPTGLVSFLDTSAANAVLGTAALGSGTEALTFAPVTAPSVQPGSFSVAVGDFNGDGKPDLAVTNRQTASVTIMLGNGDGTFTAAPSPATGANPQGLAVGDFNGDGNLDIAVANFNDNTLTVLLGNGDGTFTAAASPSVGRSPAALVVGDFNGDGNADLAVVNTGSATVTILLGNGDGTFIASESNPSIGISAYAIASADLNGDGNADLVVSNFRGNTLTLLLGIGDGTFSPGTTLATGANPLGLTIGDFNADGKADIAVANEGGSTLSVFLGNGNGTFAPSTSLSTGTNPYSVAVGDFNGDGMLDLAAPNLNDNTVTILLGNGNGTFALGATPATGGGPSFVAVADFNGDGNADLAAANQALVGTAGPAATILLAQVTQTAVATATGIAPVGGGTHRVDASYPGDTTFSASVSPATSLTGQTFAPVVAWSPAVASIPYGTPLGPQQLDATASGLNGVAVPGTFAYTPAAGSVLAVGPQTLSVLFTPTDAAYTPAAGTATITVTRATPTLTWPTPASIAFGTPLGAAQLDATATGVTGSALPGTFTYTPAAGTVLAAGTQTLTVLFTPTDAADYTTATASVQLGVGILTLTSFTPNTARVGDPSTTITLTGTGFVGNSVVQVNGVAIPTTLVSQTTLTAVIPAADLTQLGTLQIKVANPASAAATPALPFTLIAPTPSVTLTGPTTTPPGSQPALAFTVTNPYPVPLIASLNLSFVGAVTPEVDDPAIQFAAGGRNLTFTVPANSTTVPAIQLQSGTVAGTITVPVQLTALGVDVTPASLRPVVIVVPAAIPVASTTTITRSGTQLSVAIHGFSNTREVTQATFHFTAAPGATISAPDVTAPVGPLFTTWYSSPESVQYGSTFTYTQIFNVSDDANNVGSVEVTLTNTVGTSVPQTAQ